MNNKSPFKILNIDEEGRLGGPEKRIVNVAEVLKKSGIDTVIIMPLIDSLEFQKYAGKKNVTYQCINITRLSLEPKILFRYIMRFLLEIWILYNVIRQHKADVVHVNSPSQFKVAIAARLNKTRVVWHLNNTYLHPIVKLAFDATRFFVKPYYIYAGKGVFSYYSFLANSHNKMSVEAPVTGKYFEQKNVQFVNETIKIAMIGGLNPAKGIHHLPAVIEELGNLDAYFQIEIAGAVLDSQQSYVALIKQRIADIPQKNVSIKFRGYISDTSNFLAQNGVLLSLSDREASPTAVWEGMASGRIVISTSVGSVDQFIQHGENGFIINTEDNVSISAVLNELIKGKYDINELTLRAQDTAYQMFSVEKIAAKHIDAYERAICF